MAICVRKFCQTHTASKLLMLIGRTISHYKILEKLGEGGMGVVYKAEDLTLGRVVALKFVSADVSSDETVKQRLMREAKACAALNHPNITTVYEFGEDDGDSFIAIEFVEGKTLHDVLKEKRLGLQESLDVMLQVLDALDAAHKKGIVHRDLKPGNLMIDSSGRVKVMDFGLAKYAAGSLLTQAGATLGTAAYMPPEQAKGEETDHRADLYSIGVVLYQLLTGQLPFNDPHHLAVMYAIVNQDPRPPRELNPDIPPSLEEVVLKAMAKDPAQRSASSAEMGAAILGVAQSLGGARSSLKRFRSLFAGAGKGEGTEKLPARRIPWRVLLSVVAAGILITAAIVIYQRIESAKEREQKRELAKAHVEKAKEFIGANNVSLAVQELELAVQSDSTYPLAWSNLAAISVQQRDFDRAIEQSSRALELDPNYSIARYNLAYALEERGNMEEAARWYAGAIAVDSSFIQAYSALGHTYILLNKPREALAVLDRAISVSPDSKFLYLVQKNRGKAYIALGEFDNAIQALERSSTLNPHVAETALLLAQSYETEGRRQESITQWQTYLQLETDPAKKEEAVAKLRTLKK